MIYERLMVMAVQLAVVCAACAFVLTALSVAS
jgi:hypothetical protein